MDIEFIGQLVDSMEKGVLRLESSIKKKDYETAKKLKVFVFDIHRQITEALRT